MYLPRWRPHGLHRRHTFAGGIGRTDFPEGSMTDMNRSQKLEKPDSMLIYPGHGETSIIGEEKRVNPFLSFQVHV